MRSTREEPWPWVLGAVLLAALLLPASAAGDDAEPIRVVFQAPSDCPDAASFFAEVRARTTKVRSAAPGESARTFTVTVAVEARKVRGQLTIEEPPGPVASREVTGDKCGEIISALALITALAVDPRASTAPSSSLLSPPPEQPVSPAPSASATARPVLPPPPPPLRPIPPPRLPLLPLPPPPPRWRFSVGTDFAGVAGIAPSLSPGVAMFFDAERQGPSLVTPTLRASIVWADSGILGRPPVHSRFVWLIGRIEGCPLRFSPNTRVEISPCAFLDGGAIEASGWGRASSDDRTRPWIAPGLLGRIRVDIFGPLLIEAQGGAMFPLVRDTFYVAPFEVNEVPVAGGFFAAGVGLHFF